MSIDLKTLSSGELDSLISQAKQRKAQLRKRKPPASVRGKIEALAAAEGYSLAELYVLPGKRGATQPAKGAKKAAKKTASSRKLGKVAPKYRNPANAKETWTGRGLPPRWMADLIKKGKKREDFLIAK